MTLSNLNDVIQPDFQRRSGHGTLFQMSNFKSACLNKEASFSESEFPPDQEIDIILFCGVQSSQKLLEKKRRTFLAMCYKMPMPNL